MPAKHSMKILEVLFGKLWVVENTIERAASLTKELCLNKGEFSCPHAEKHI